jgi:hypothetical protein
LSHLCLGASGAVYQATDLSALPHEKHVAIKILNPIGFRLSSSEKINYANILKEGMKVYEILPIDTIEVFVRVSLVGIPHNSAQKQGKMPMIADNIWWAFDSQSKQIFAAFEVGYDNV